VGKFLAAGAVLLLASGASSAASADPLTSLHGLVGTWTCTYVAGSERVTYKASFAYDMGGNWIRERDSWSGGGSDEDLFTYDPKGRAWTAIVVENERDAVLFRANGGNADHVVYRSVYPNANMTDVFDRLSPTKYTLHFSQVANGKATNSTDTCVKE
jgi:hypothetical protein